MAIPRHPRLPRGIFWFAALLCAAFWSPDFVAAADPGAAGSLSDRQAQYVIKFVSFTTWPDQTKVEKGAKSPARIIGVLGDEVGALAIEEFVAKTTAGTGPEITVRRIRQTDDLEGCHVLLVGDGYDEAKWNSALNGLREKPVLTVGSGRVFAQRQGLIGLFLKNERLLFAVNFKRVEASGLRLSSNFLKLAEIVED